MDEQIGEGHLPGGQGVCQAEVRPQAHHRSGPGEVFLTADAVDDFCGDGLGHRGDWKAGLRGDGILSDGRVEVAAGEKGGGSAGGYFSQSQTGWLGEKLLGNGVGGN